MPTDAGAVIADDVGVSQGERGSFVFSKTSGLTVSEQGDVATFTVALIDPPTASVQLPITSLDPAEVVATQKALIFTKTNWNAPQQVEVRGVDDLIADGHQDGRIAFGPSISDDPRYSGVTAPDAVVKNVDNETPSIRVSQPTSARVAETTLSASNQLTFGVALTSRPIAVVDIPISASVLGAVDVSPPSLHFTPEDWSSSHVVLVRGVENLTADGDRAVVLSLGPASSADVAYDLLKGDPVSIVVEDDETPGFDVIAPTPLQVSESGTQATVTMALKSLPTSPVTIDVGSSKTSEMVASPSTLTFTSTNWNAPQTIFLRGVDDQGIVDGNQKVWLTFAAAKSTDVGYNGRKPDDVAVTNLDNDTPAVLVSSPFLTILEGGAAVTISVHLSAQPTSNVRVPVRSTDVTKVVVSTSELVFTSANWQSIQQFTVMAIDNQGINSAQLTYVELGTPVSTDPQYTSVVSPKIPVTITDDEVAGVIVSTSSIVTGERGESATFTVRLTAKPTADVTIPISSSRPSEASVSPAALVFSTTNWASPQTVIVKGLDDSAKDGDQPYRIDLGTPASTDMRYTSLNPPGVIGTNRDNDSAGFLVSPTSGLTTTEGAGSTTFTVVLTGYPTASVTIAVRSSNTDESTVSPASLVFTPANWSVPQVVRVTGVNDDVADGNVAYSVFLDPAVSTDVDYSGKKASDVSLVNNDDDAAAVIVSASLLTTSENGTSSMFTVKLASKPFASVTVSLTSSNTGEVTVSPSALTFTAANWNLPQAVSVQGMDDSLIDGSRWVTIVTSAAVSADPAYSGLAVADVTVANQDDDNATSFSVTGLTSPTTVGAPHSVTITALKASSLVATAYTGTVRFTSSDSGAILPANYTFVAGDNGVHTFTDAAALIATGSTISATDTTSPSVIGTSGAVTVNAPALACDSGNFYSTCTVSGAKTVPGGTTLAGMGSLLVTGTGSIALSGSGTLTLYFTGDVTVATGGTISVDAYGSAGGASTTTSVVASGTAGGIGAGAAGSAGGGGGHGGAGGAGSSATSGLGGTTFFGSVSAPTTLGSGGGGSSFAAGAAGGGAMKITANGTLSVDGTLSANGGAAAAGNPHSAGSGAGGSLWIVTGTLAGGAGGVIRANGGNGADGTVTDSGGGGGGRIAASYTTSTYTGSMVAYGGTAGGGTGKPAGAGTVYQKPTGSSATLKIDNNAVVGEQTYFDLSANLAFSLVTITGAARVILLNTQPTMTIAAMTIAATGSIDHSALGSAGGIITTTSVTGAGAAPGVGASGAAGGGGGGGYGGAGAAGGGGTGGAGGGTTGLNTTPTTLGSGGGGSSTQVGGAGGGAIRLIVTGTLTVAGSIKADGVTPAAGSTRGSGGGSGGSIYLTVGTLAGNGTIAARGGAGGDGTAVDGGGGGGGRIAIYRAVDASAIVPSAAAGVGATAGTLFTSL